MSDEELDKVFKEAAEGFTAPQDSSAWQDMLNRLDKHPMPAGFWNWKTVSTVAVVGAFSVAVVLYQSAFDTDNLKADKISTNQAVEEKHKKSGENKLAETDSPSSQNEEIRIEANNKIKYDTKPGVGSALNQNLHKPVAKVQVPDSESLEGRENVLYPANELMNPVRKSGEDASSVSNGSVQSYALANQASNNLVADKTPQNQHHVDKDEQKVVKKNSQAMSDSLAGQMAPQQESAFDSARSHEEKELPEKKENKFRSTLGIKFAIAPDYTSVNHSTPDRLGFGYGVLLEYRFNDHWSVATGGIWTKKIYTAYDVEYNGHNADWVDGDCRMWDVPVNIYYTFTPAKSFSFYASLGLSSYLMNEENYIFYVETPYGVYDYPQHVKGENNEWFKTLNVSLGMQLKVNNKLTFQFEPILKAPLTGVGEGEVSLVSMGAFFNLRFDIPITKKP